ncbi:hypothetical protein Taro_047981 [Colocasia esculenta]|uniref:Uncharacterized protein n=1 Tax=Colocasia esculenta TaxID=4460 RepID=A0A843X209_COLES|nr:hypothetical protein [Colocasia esculenta]
MSILSLLPLPLPGMKMRDRESKGVQEDRERGVTGITPERGIRGRSDQMTQLMNPTPSEESDATANPPILTPEEAFRQTLRSWYGPSEGGSSSNNVYQRLLEEQSQQKSEISQQKSEIERMKKIIEDQQQRIAAQSTDIDVRVEAQVEARVEARLAELQTQMLQSMDERLQELIRIRMSGSGAPTVLPEDETEGEERDGEDDGTFGEDELLETASTVSNKTIGDGSPPSPIKLIKMDGAVLNSLIGDDYAPSPIVSLETTPLRR